jgi:hypothetical protein
VFESTSGNIWQVIRVEDREAGQYAEVFATSRPADRYFWHTDSLRLMRIPNPFKADSAARMELQAV